MDNHWRKYEKCYWYFFKSIIYTAFLIVLSEWFIINLRYIEHYFMNITKTNTSEVFNDVKSSE